MTIGDYFIFGFITIIFCLGIFVGIRLFRWNQKDMQRKKDKNIKLKEDKNQLNE